MTRVRTGPNGLPVRVAPDGTREELDVENRVCIPYGHNGSFARFGRRLMARRLGKFAAGFALTSVVISLPAYSVGETIGERPLSMVTIVTNPGEFAGRVVDNLAENTRVIPAVGPPVAALVENTIGRIGD